MEAKVWFTRPNGQKSQIDAASTARPFLSFVKVPNWIWPAKISIRRSKVVVRHPRDVAVIIFVDISSTRGAITLLRRWFWLGWHFISTINFFVCTIAVPLYADILGGPINDENEGGTPIKVAYCSHIPKSIPSKAKEKLWDQLCDDLFKWKWVFVKQYGCWHW